MQPARHLVPGAAELAAGVQHRQDHLGGRLLGILRMSLDGDAATIVGDAARAVCSQGDFDGAAVPCHCLVDGVVHHLVDEMVKTSGAGRADEHPRAFTDRLETLEHRDRIGVVVAGNDVVSAACTHHAVAGACRRGCQGRVGHSAASLPDGGRFSVKEHPIQYQ